MELRFSGPIFTWRGPAPFYYVAVPDEESEDIRDVANAVSYGWGVVPVHATIGGTSYETSLFPKDGRYLLGVKAAVRRSERLDEGDRVAVRMTVVGAAPSPQRPSSTKP
jgi:hypothetical protein